ncbi:hypothetical protein IQ07DRAFT_522489 [Pyrenochaeta sp. DS3sAY3a]|nr:hypothetical protein IQ07DRAFT_522489 [Pyrenochaeta sp. DS3sAY3a]
MPIGPSLPPQPAKRTHDGDPASSDKRRRVLGPAPPPATSSRSSSPDSDIGPALPQAHTSKPVRAVGPTLPPAPLDQRPPHPADDDSDSSSDDDFGPAPPPAGAAYTHHDNETRPATKSAFDTDPQFTKAPQKPQRDDWMTMPPTQDDLAARMDPTKMRARKFNTGKSAGGGGGMSTAWTETPEQKLKRLQDEAMGITTSAAPGPAAGAEPRRNKDEERRMRKMREKIDASRGKSLIEQHQEKGTGKEKEDDPSKRAFDYEKDMAVSGNINNKQRREMLNKSKGFGDRFASGSFL